MSGAEFMVVEVLDGDDPCRPVGVQVSALGWHIGISNTTERAVRIVVGGTERVLWPSPRRAESDVVGLVLWRSASTSSDDFDFHLVGETHIVEPVPLDALIAELLLLGGDSPGARPH